MSEIIHIGEISPSETLFLKKMNDRHYVWFLGNQETGVSAPNIEEAIRLAKKFWKNSSFKLIPCGFRFSLPERDEHGSNALFYQAVRSLNSMSGVYFDEEVGHNCIVHQIPLKVRSIYEKLKEQGG